MAILNPVVAKFGLIAGQVQAVYTCPAGTSYSIVDVNFFKNDTSQDALIEIALSTQTDPAQLTSVDYFIDDISLIGNVNSAELSKVVVGPNQILYVKVISGPTINVRVTGVEQVNSKIAAAGRLAAASIPGVNQTLVYSNAIPSVSYISTSITVFNTNTTTQATIEIWITSSPTPSDSDKILNVNIPAQDTTILENLVLAPNESIYVRSSQANSEYFVNGMVVLS
jgi:hypothetical protein